ncbi:MAG: hypothetical protein IRZ11_08305 [Clostridia bacterium]|nr:hypothetical protein [Clostridia bacterium]
MTEAWLLLGLRTVAIGVERVLLKAVGSGGRSLPATFWFFALAFVLITPLGAARPLPWTGRLFASASGVLFAAAYAALALAFAEGEVSRLAPLTGLSHLVLLVLAAASGRERPGAPQLLGVLLLLAGTARLGGGSLAELPWVARDRGGRLLLLYSALVATERLLDQAGARAADPYAYAWTMFGSVTLVLGASLATTGRHQEALAVLRSRSGLLALAAGTNVVTYLTFVALLDDFPVTVLEPAAGLSYLVTAWLSRAVYGEDLRGRVGAALAIALGSTLTLVR